MAAVTKTKLVSFERCAAGLAGGPRQKLSLGETAPVADYSTGLFPWEYLSRILANHGPSSQSEWPVLSHCKSQLGLRCDLCLAIKGNLQANSLL